MSSKDSKEWKKVEGTATVEVYRGENFAFKFEGPTLYTTAIGVGIDNGPEFSERLYLRHPVILSDGRYEFPSPQNGPFLGATYIDADGHEHGLGQGHFTLVISEGRTKKDGDFNVSSKTDDISVKGIFRFAQ
ncbi:hypothetical protein [Pseudomonas marginalis]|jgi:hypothetical protein|uniref:hypothetical protein n=1 Tax=Pseudomonas marginalis TaxID=298 RepID=UPI002480577F|nr:hypothetical protein [Pseudomonas marginalis]WGT29070.1 hypothetical protein QGQ83_04480 [Pseudomonas marginalis]